MNDLISREALYEKTCEWEAQALHMCEVTMNDEDKTEWRRWSAILKERSAFKFDVADATAVDAVEVIRCKDCKWYVFEQLEKDGTDDLGYKLLYCVNLAFHASPDWFCADAERREHE